MVAKHTVRRTKHWWSDITGNVSAFWKFGVMSRGRCMEWSWKGGAVGSAGEVQPAALGPQLQSKQQRGSCKSD